MVQVQYKKTALITASIILLSLGVWALVRGVFWYSAVAAQSTRDEIINKVVSNHQTKEIKSDDQADPFGEDGIARILLIGLDKRVGQMGGNCDAIQLVTIDKAKQSVIITAVPRGTYSPLPPGKATTSSDYYVSNACRLGGLEYGIGQIEKILGQHADYLVVVGFSETLGILRNLKLPTASTLQWLRQRHAYAIGEPQRARNHSTFLKNLLVRFIPTENSTFDKAWQYITYKTTHTDLSFAETQALVGALSAMDLSNHPERVQLSMRPAHAVQDIQYVPENLEKYLDTTLGSIKNILSKKDFSGVSATNTQAHLLKMINDKKDDVAFIVWVFENNLWLQIEDDEKRLFTQFNFLERYLSLASVKENRSSLISDYILEMEHRGEGEWAKKGEGLLAKEIPR